MINHEISREWFENQFSILFGNDGDEFFNFIESKVLPTSAYATEDFAYICRRTDGDITIIDMDTLDTSKPKYINWYKLYHVGRCLVISNIDSQDDVRAFLKRIKEDINDVH